MAIGRSRFYRSACPPTLEELQTRHGTRYKWLVLLTVMIGTMASVLSSTIVNVAVPDLSRYFGLGQERAQWVSAGFMLAMTLSMLTTPWLLQRFGLRRTYTGCILLLLFGGLVGGFSTNYPMLLAMRVAEGLAAGVLQPIPAIVIMRAFDRQERGRAMGIFSFGVVLAPAIGPSVGGFLVELFGWRSIFFVVVPFCLAVLLMVHRLLPVNSALRAPVLPLDWKGLLLAAIGITCLLNGLVHLHDGWIEAAAFLVPGVVASLAFIGWQLRVEGGLMNMQLFRHREFAMSALVAFIYGAGLFGSTYLFPVYMQMALHYSPSEAGVVLLPAGFVLGGTIILAGRLADRLEPRLLVSFGLALLTLSFVLMAFASGGAAYAALLGIAIVGRVGLGFVLPALSLGALRGLSPDLLASGSSTINFMRQLGGAMGIGMVGIVLQWRLAAGTASHAFAETFLLVAAICGAAVAAAWRMTPQR